ncbi:hypothetical protein COLU111180_00700 [Cohnella lubricantis]|uniref:Uncharacterized protein n=1 Tax=Cohnella lubricantis TaxID=2163172 RepID=A0A841TE89_9BACL|nr:hypothetical protein [Cohnella lubricantis]MBB6679743.1 hypothetical protein [Cohnella lubricantis]MBP2119465.1 hypothetical protein [Cohnella lubricantis]
MVKMKRYAVTLALVLLMAASLTTYYAYGAKLRLPEYRLQTLEGDPAEGAELRIEGSFVGGKGSYYLGVTAEGSEYGNDSLWQRLLYTGNAWIRRDIPDIGALYREHSQFMRGKTNENGFYHDKDWLVYADAEVVQPDLRLVWRIDVLETSTGQRIRYNGEGAEPLGQMDFVNVIDVQKAGDDIHVLTGQGRLGRPEEYRDEVFDAETGKPVRSVKLQLGEPSAPDRELQINYIAEQTLTAPNPHLVFIVEQLGTKSANPAESGVAAAADGAVAEAVPNDQRPKILSRSAMVYSYESGEMDSFPLTVESDESAPEEIWSSRLLVGDTLSILTAAKDAVTVTHYNVTDGSKAAETIIRADQIGQGEIKSALMANNRIYVLVKKDENTDMPIAAVADAADGRILYRGQPVLEDPNGRPQEQLDDVWLSYLGVRR